MRYFTICLFVLILIIGCDSDNPVDQSDLDFQSLNGGNFEFEVDRAIETPATTQFLKGDILESNYEELNEVVIHDVTFSEDGQTVVVDQSDLDFQSLNGGNFEFEVDRAIETPATTQFLKGDILESNYEELNEVVIYDVTFSEDGQTVVIEPGSIYGQMTNDSVESIYYELGEETFAGGQFIVWINDNEFEAELTIFGSGIPIVKSERGHLY